MRRAVGSPNLSATYPCAISCRIAEKTRIMMLRSPKIIGFVNKSILYIVK